VELVGGAAGSNLKVSGKDGRQSLGSEVATVKREVPTSLLETAMTMQEVPMWKLDVAVTTMEVARKIQHSILDQGKRRGVQQQKQPKNTKNKSVIALLFPILVLSPAV
jgi:hypothetical protein